ncbi:winged helix-turn-helix domain-containing protein [Geodermatophilus sp. SYSU D00758]
MSRSPLPPTPCSVLVVEGAPALSHAVRQALAGGPDRITAVGGVAEGAGALRSGAAEVTVLVSDRSDPAACRTLRRVSAAPLVVVTGAPSSEDVVAGLEAGADTVLPATRVAAELVPRVRGLVGRWRERTGEPPLVTGALALSAQGAAVTLDGVPVALTPTEFRLLRELAVAGGRVLSRAELLRRVWGYDHDVGQRLVDVHVRRLRRKLGAHLRHPALVATERGAGYRLRVP